MTWWVLTYLDNYRPWTSLHVLAHTNHPAHLMMAWSTIQPARSPVYRNVRGTQVFCGYKYIWDTPNLTEQSESGDTSTHTFHVAPLEPTDHVWYVLSSTTKLYDRYCQSPLIHVPPPELPMASARIFHSLSQPIPTAIAQAVTFDSVFWDDSGFYDPAEPTRLTVPADGLYEIGCCMRMENAIAPGARIWITLNAADPIVRHSHRQEGLDVWGCAFSMNTLMRLQLADFLQVHIYHLAGGNRNLLAFDHWSPHFWIHLIGPYPL